MQCCSGHDGSWSVKKENFEASMKVGKPLFKFMKNDDSCTASDCPLSADPGPAGDRQRKPVHPIEISRAPTARNEKALSGIRPGLFSRLF
jgi:hypothetical protein